MALKRKTPLKQKTALRRTTKIKKAKPGVTAAQMHQRRVLAVRSGSRCEFERLCELHGPEEMPPGAGNGFVWIRCNTHPGMVCHIYGRPHCGKARDLPEVALYGCHACHRIFDNHSKSGVRAPLKYAQKAWDCVVGLSKKNAEGNPIHNLGPRPEAGEGVYR